MARMSRRNRRCKGEESDGSAQGVTMHWKPSGWYDLLGMMFKE
jgi:hypothetical protein